MTPAQHLAEAEAILADVASMDTPALPAVRLAFGVTALAHAVVAAAAELGVPHNTTAPGGNGAQTPA